MGYAIVDGASMIGVGTASWVREVAAEAKAAAVVFVRRGLGVEEIEAACRRAQRGTDIGHYQLAVHLSEMAERGLHQLVGCSSAVHFARAKLDMSRRQARDLIAAGKALMELPQIQDAFCEGRISWTKTRMLCGVAVAETEKKWLEVARDLSCEALERRLAGIEKGRPPRDDERGLPHVRLAIRVKVDPLRYELWEQARKKVAALAGEEVSESDAFSAIVEEFLKRPAEGETTGSCSGGSAFRVVVGLSTLGKDAWVATDDGPVAIPRGEAEAVACDADEWCIEGAVTPEVRAALGIDRKTPESLRRRILARDRHACRHCGSHVAINVHHIVFRSHGGRTEAGNTAVLCRTCHSLVHEGHLTIQGDPEGRLAFSDRHGQPTTLRVRAPNEDLARVVVEPAAAAQEPDRAEGRTLAPLAGPCVAPRTVVTFETLPSEAPAGFWPAHAHLFSWNDRSGGLAFSEGIPATPVPGGACAPPSVPGHRPQILADVIGQERAVASLRLAIQAAAIRGRPVPHLLLSGGPGLGKTSLARAMAAEIGKAVHLTSGPALADPATLVGLLARARAGDVVFVDEIHALPRPVAEMLYEAMEDRRLSLPVTQGVASRTLTLELQPLTLVGATTDPDRVPAPLRSRFGLVLELEPYAIEDLARMTERAANAERLAIDPAAATLLAGAAHGTPREVLTLVARAVDLGVARTRHRIDVALAAETLRGLGIDHRGLGPIHRRILGALAAIGCRALSQSRLALAAAVSPRALREVYEPALIRLGLIDITPRGRRLATDFACSP